MTFRMRRGCSRRRAVPCVLFSIWFRASSESSPSHTERSGSAAAETSGRIACTSLLALLYDIHGNLPALEAVLADAGEVEGFVLGGDYATAGAWPRETVERLKELENATWIRGNADRWLVDRHDAPAPIDAIAERTAELLGAELVDELSTLPESVAIDGTLYCHASPSSDMETFFPEPGERDAELLMGVEAKRVVCGHIHISFGRRGPGGIELVNPGSVGMPWDGDHRAAYAVIDGDRVERRRVEYDWEASVAAVQRTGGGAARAPHGACAVPSGLSASVPPRAPRQCPRPT